MCAKRVLNVISPLTKHCKSLQPTWGTNPQRKSNELKKQQRIFFCEDQRKCTTLQAAYSTDVSVCHECGKFDQSLNDWDPAKPFVASELVKIFDVTHTDSSHKIKLLAQDVNPTIPGLETIPKRKSTRVKLKESDLSMPVPPNKKHLIEIDRSLVESGVLNEDVLCVPA